MKPILVKQISDSEGNIIEKTEPQVVRKVISKQTSDTLCDILEGVVSEGTQKCIYQWIPNSMKDRNIRNTGN